MTPAPALTEATMDKMTVEQIEQCRSLLAALTVDASKPPGQFLMKQPEWTNRVNALCDLAKLALTPAPDVAGLVEELRAYRPDDGNHWKAPNVCTQAADALLSLSARNRELEGENGKLTIALEDVALLDGADGHELTSGHASQAVEIAKKTLGKHPSVIFGERFQRQCKEREDVQKS